MDNRDRPRGRATHRPERSRSRSGDRSNASMNNSFSRTSLQSEQRGDNRNHQNRDMSRGGARDEPTQGNHTPNNSNRPPYETGHGFSGSYRENRGHGSNGGGSGGNYQSQGSGQGGNGGRNHQAQGSGQGCFNQGGQNPAPISRFKFSIFKF